MKVKELLKEMPDDSTLSFSLSIQSGQVTRCAFDAPEDPLKVRMAVLMRPLLAPDSPLSCRKTWSLLRDCCDFDEKLVSNVEESFIRLETGHGEFFLNQRRMKLNELYEILASGEFFTEEAEALAMLQAFKFGPATEMLWLHFYSYTHAMFGIASALLQIGVTHGVSFELEQVSSLCIYCGSTEGSFTSEEHIIPEAFGNDEAVLAPGYVCDSCNNFCSQLDNYLAECELVSFGRTLAVPHTKKGRLPKAQFQGVTVERRLPRVITFHENSGANVFSDEEQLPDGLVAFKLTLQSRKPLNERLLARALFKIALAFIAFQESREVVLSPRYDAARSFVAGQSVFDNSLAIGSLPGAPELNVAFRWWSPDEGGTMCVAEFYGAVMVFNLEVEPKLQMLPDDPIAERFKLFDLSREDE